MKLAAIALTLLLIGIAVLTREESYCDRCRKKPTWSCIQVCDLGLAGSQ